MYNEYFYENSNITQDNITQDNITQDYFEQNNESRFDSDSDSDFDFDYRLKKFKGKTIVLVESDNPWYLNKDETIQLPYKKNIRLTNKRYREDADYGSYENKNNENFNGKIKKNKNTNTNKNQEQFQNHIIILLMVFLFSLIIYNKCIKNNKK